MRERTTWTRSAALNKVADPYLMNQDHVSQQPSADDYVIGDSSTFAEDVHPSKDSWEAEYAGGQVKRNEIGMPEMRKDTFNHPEKTAADHNLLLKKADLCIRTASLMVGAAGESAVEDQAVALMHMPDADLINTYTRLANTDPMADMQQQSAFQQQAQMQQQASDLMQQAAQHAQAGDFEAAQDCTAQAQACLAQALQAGQGGQAVGQAAPMAMFAQQKKQQTPAQQQQQQQQVQASQQKKQQQGGKAQGQQQQQVQAAQQQGKKPQGQGGQAQQAQQVQASFQQQSEMMQQAVQQAVAQAMAQVQAQMQQAGYQQATMQQQSQTAPQAGYQQATTQQQAGYQQATTQQQAGYQQAQTAPQATWQQQADQTPMGMFEQAEEMQAGDDLMGMFEQAEEMQAGDMQADDAALAEMLSQTPAMEAPVTSEMGIEMDPALMDVGDMSGMAPEDDVLMTLFAADQQDGQGQGQKGQGQGQGQKAQQKQAMSRTASTRTVGTRPTGGVSRVGGSFGNGGDVNKLSALWPSAPDVSDAFR